MIKLVILAYDEGKVHTYTVEKGLQYEEYEDLITKFGHRLADCYWIVVDSDNDIIIH